MISLPPGRPGAGGGSALGTAGILGVDYDPLTMTAAGRPPENTSLPTDEKRFQRRMGLLDRLQGDYANHGGQQEVADHQKIYAQASRLVLSPKMTGFDIEKEPQKAKDLYGSSPFGQSLRHMSGGRKIPRATARTTRPKAKPSKIKQRSGAKRVAAPSTKRARSSGRSKGAKRAVAPKRGSAAPKRKTKPVTTKGARRR